MGIRSVLGDIDYYDLKVALKQLRQTSWNQAIESLRGNGNERRVPAKLAPGQQTQWIEDIMRGVSAGTYPRVCQRVADEIEAILAKPAEATA